MLAELNARILRVEVVSVKEDVFYGNIVVEKEGQIYNIDSRPSDSFALAVRAHVPILMSSEVLDAAGIVPSADLMQDTPEAAEPEAPAGENGAETQKRLSVFEDFLQNLDFNDSDDENNADPPSDEPNSPDKPE